MKFLSAIATVLIFGVGIFFKLNRVVHIINQPSSESAYQQTNDAGYGGYSSGSSRSSSSSYPSGVQSNPYVK